MDGELWHIVEAKRDDGTPTMFRIRELDPQKQLTRIFVVELPYRTMELSRLPTADAYRRLGELEEQWLRPACASLGWEIVGSKTEDGSFFLYMYGASDPNALVERISPFDAALGFYDDEDPDWLEYATLRELLDQAKAMPALEAVVLPELTVPLPAITKVVGGAKAGRTNGAHVAPPSMKSSALKKTAPLRKSAKNAKASAAKATAKKSAKSGAAKGTLKKRAKAGATKAGAKARAKAGAAKTSAAKSGAKTSKKAAPAKSKAKRRG